MMSQSRRSFLIAAVAAVAALFSFGFLQASSALAKAPGRLQGTLVSVDLASSTVSVKLQNGTIQGVHIETTTKVERNGVRVSLGAFKVGDRVQARYSLDGATVVKFEGTGP